MSSTLQQTSQPLLTNLDKYKTDQFKSFAKKKSFVDQPTDLSKSQKVLLEDLGSKDSKEPAIAAFGKKHEDPKVVRESTESTVTVSGLGASPFAFKKQTLNARPETIVPEAPPITRQLRKDADYEFFQFSVLAIMMKHP